MAVTVPARDAGLGQHEASAVGSHVVELARDPRSFPDEGSVLVALVPALQPGLRRRQQSLAAAV